MLGEGRVLRWLRRGRTDVVLALLVLAAAAPVVQPLKAQQASRLALTAAVWDDHSIRIDRYPIGVDHVVRDGHVYSDKAPGQPLLGVPAYAAYRALGGEPAARLRVDGNLGLWAVNLLTSVLPTIALVLLVRRAADRVRDGSGAVVAVITLLATMVLPFATVLFSHALSACLGFGAWYVLSRRTTDRALFTCGALLGGAVLVEFTFAVTAVVLTGLAVRLAGARAWHVIAGGAPAAMLLLVYQWAAFGNPFIISYSTSAFSSASQAAGDTGPRGPAHWWNRFEALVGERGLFVISPVVLLAAAGMVVLVRSASRSDRPAHVAAALCALGPILVQLAWSNPTGGDAPGPRYAMAAAVFLSPGLAVAWARWRDATVVLAALGATFMVAATWTDPLEARDTSGAIGVWLAKLADGEWANTVYAMATRTDATSLLLAMSLVPGLMLVRGRRRARITPRRAARASGP